MRVNAEPVFIIGICFCPSTPLRTQCGQTTAFAVPWTQVFSLWQERLQALYCGSLLRSSVGALVLRFLLEHLN